MDPTVQIQIIDLILKLNRKEKIGIFFISHDLNQVFYLSEKVIVISEGIIMEMGDADEIMKNPHPYTMYLMKGKFSEANREKGKCPFYSICPLAKEICRDSMPELKKTGENHLTRCHLL